VSVSGCLALNALVGAGSLLLSGPAQYIGTVYTVGEYAYEYAANGKTPVAVVGEKLDKLDKWLNPRGRQNPHEDNIMLAAIQPKPETVIPGNMVGDPPVHALPMPMISSNSTYSPPLLASLPLSPSLNTSRETRNLSEPFRSIRTKRQPDKIVPVITAKKKAAPTPRTAPLRPKQKKSVQPATRAPVLIAATQAPPQKLLQLQRMEQAFAHAERTRPASANGNAVRISLGNDPSGVSGTWSIRHKVTPPDLS